MNYVIDCIWAKEKSNQDFKGKLKTITSKT